MILAAAGGTQIVFIIGYIIFFAALMYFIAIRPQKKQQKKQQELLNSMEKGDSVLTTSGFYGVVIDITDDTVIVEFGNNKNCRIPMQKAAIVEIEKAEA
ncbi:MAG: preprotein translocase subunit YajC [Lachnospiraceae bacterium]|nr:preprotein translocase subunit YajC [Lachnospiraceae bacterium]